MRTGSGTHSIESGAGEATAGVNTVLCPACRGYCKRGSAFCFSCFCKLPQGIKYMLADSQRRAHGIAAGVHVLQTIQRDAERARGGNLFPSPEAAL